jgi:hypothetical protein
MNIINIKFIVTYVYLNYFREPTVKFVAYMLTQELNAYVNGRYSFTPGHFLFK